MTAKKKGIVTSVLFLAFSIVMIIFAKDIKPMMENDLGSGFFPMVIGIAMCGLSVLRLVVALREKEKEAKKSGDDLMGGLGTLILIGAYCLAFNTVGFIISTIVYLFLQILLLRFCFLPAWERAGVPVMSGFHPDREGTGNLVRSCFLPD